MTESDVAPVHAPSVQADRRGSWLPTAAMISARFLELRERRGLMIVVIAMSVGIPGIFVVIRLIMHAAAPKSYGPAGGFDFYRAITENVLYLFAFIVAVAFGATAGCADLNEGVFRHLVVTGRSRLALYLARVPAGLGIVAPLVAVGYGFVCAVCVYAAPPLVDYAGMKLRPGLSATGFENWAVEHPTDVVCGLSYSGPAPANLPCGEPSTGGGAATGPSLTAFARQVARQNYEGYTRVTRTPSMGLMIETGLWLELQAVVGFVVALGLAALIGQRTVAVILVIVMQIVLEPFVEGAAIPHLANLQRAAVGLAVVDLEPSAMQVGYGAFPPPAPLPESAMTAIFVILAWLVGWTALGARRMVRRDA